MIKPTNADMYDWDKFNKWFDENFDRTVLEEYQIILYWSCWKNGFTSAIGHTLRKEAVVETLRRT